MGRRHRNKRRAKSIPDALGRAETKLAQANLLLGDLQNATGKSMTAGNSGALEAYFSACLGLAKSAYYLMLHTGAPFQNAQREWLKGIGGSEAAFFARMKGLRDDDVHFANTSTKRLTKYEDEDEWRRRSPFRDSDSVYYHSRLIHNAALFGPRPVIEQTNPDGTVVRGATLRGTVGHAPRPSRPGLTACHTSTYGWPTTSTCRPTGLRAID